jgi:hypothetical protein
MANQACTQAAIEHNPIPQLKQTANPKRKYNSRYDPKILRIEGVSKNGKPFLKEIFLLDDN